MGRAGSPVVCPDGHPHSTLAGTAHSEHPLCGAGISGGTEGRLRLGSWRPSLSEDGEWRGRTHLANTGLGLTDLGVAMAVATFTGAQVEAAGHACVACATFLATEDGGGWAYGERQRRKRPASTVEEAGRTGGGTDRCWGPGLAHLAGRAAVPKGTGTLLYFQC